MSAESLLSLPAVLPAVPGGAAPASPSDGGETSAFEVLLADALGEDAAPAEEAPADSEAVSADTRALAIPNPMSLPIVPGVTDDAGIEPGDDAADTVSPTDAPQPLILAGPGDEAAEPGEPVVLNGPGDEAAEPVVPTVLAGPGAEAPEPVRPPVLAGPGVEAPLTPAPQVLTGPDAEAPEPDQPVVLTGPGAEASEPIPPEILPEILTGPGAQAPVDRVQGEKSPSNASGKGADQPEILSGPSAEAPRDAAGTTSAPGDSKAPVKADEAATLPPPIAAEAESPAATPVETAAAPPDDTAPAMARDASLSSLSRATIETTAQIAAQITRRLEGRYSRFEMALTPEGLGRVDVSLDIDADGQLAARLAFDNPLAAFDMRGRVDELRRQLEESGFKLAADAFQFTERDPQSRGDGFDGRRERAFARSSRLNADADLEISAPVAGRWMSLSLTPDRVDLKV